MQWTPARPEEPRHCLPAQLSWSYAASSKQLHEVCRRVPLTFHLFYFFGQAFRMAPAKIEYYSWGNALKRRACEESKVLVKFAYLHFVRLLVFIATVNCFAFFDNPPKLHQLLPTRRGRFLYNIIKPFEHRNIITLLTAENMPECFGCQPKYCYMVRLAPEAILR